MYIITWLVVGLIAGILASALMGRSGFGIAADIVLGIVGAFVGGWGFRELHWHAPFTGMAGVVFVASVGAVAVLVALRLIRGATTRSRRI